MSHTALSATFEKLERNRVRAMVENDIAALDAILHDSLAYGHSNGAVDDKDTYLEKMRSGMVRYLKSDVSISRVVHRGETVLIYSHVKMSATLKDQPRDLNNLILGVWVKDGDAWKMIAHHPTPV